MNAFKWSLVAALSLFLVYTALDRRHTQEQLREINKTLESLRQAMNAPRQIPPSVTTTVAPEASSSPERDGNPRLGVNFLLPYDRSTYHPEQRRGTLREFEETPRRLNQLLDNSTTTESIYSLISDSLCSRPPAHPEQWQEALATSVIISDDWKTYTITLRHGVYWHKPMISQRPEFSWLNQDVEMTAKDFIFALDLIMDPAVDCPALRNYYEDLAHWEALDPYTLKITWKNKVYTSLAFSLGIAPLPTHIYGKNKDGTAIAKERLGITFNQHWFDDFKIAVGVGAYQFETFEPDKILRFVLNPHYWGIPQHFDAIEWNLEVRKPDPQLIAFKNGQVHDHVLMPLQFKSEVLDRHEPRFAAYDAMNAKAGRSGELGWERCKRMAYSYLGWNMRRAPFNDRNVRQALSYAFPKERILKEVYFGLGIPVNTDVHPDSQYYNHDLQSYAFDLTKARTLLAEAGWSDSDGDGVLDKMIDGQKKNFRFVMKYYANSAEWDNSLLIYKDELRRIGIDMEPKSYEWKELIRIYEDKDFDATVGGWGQSWDKDFYQLWHSSQADVQGGSNHCGFKNAHVDALAEKLRLTFDTDARIKIAKEIQQILHVEQPYTFFRSVEGIFIWQNHGDPNQHERWLDGVTTGFDTLHPLVNRQPVYWHFRD